MRRLAVLSALALLLSGPVRADAPSVFDDENIETEALNRIASLHIPAAHINVACLNRRLLLTGEVPSEAAKAEVDKAVAALPKVRGISNELVVDQVSGVASRTRDSWITSDVKSGLRRNGLSRDHTLKVVAENGTVYLMGSLSRKDAAAAADIASTTSRVRRVVMVFEYTD
jgi:osmotically-inducible protein OsmY